MEASKQQAEVGRLLTRAEQSSTRRSGVRNRVQYRATTAGPTQHSAQHGDFEFDPIQGELRTTTSPPPLLPAGGGREEEGEGRKGRVIWMDRCPIWIKHTGTQGERVGWGGVGPTYPTLRHPAWHLSFGSVRVRPAAAAQGRGRPSLFSGSSPLALHMAGIVGWVLLHSHWPWLCI